MNSFIKCLIWLKGLSVSLIYLSYSFIYLFLYLLLLLSLTYLHYSLSVISLFITLIYCYHSLSSHVHELINIIIYFPVCHDSTHCCLIQCFAKVFFFCHIYTYSSSLFTVTQWVMIIVREATYTKWTLIVNPFSKYKKTTRPRHQQGES